MSLPLNYEKYERGVLMKKILSVCIFLILLILLLPYSKVFAQASLEKHESLAIKLVNQCANIQENDFESDCFSKLWDFYDEKIDGLLLC